MSTQKQYWYEMVRLKGQIFYLEDLCGRSATIDFWIKIFLAVTSSSSIAGWAIWWEYDFVWATLIACSQVVNAVKHLLPFEKRHEVLVTLGHELNNLVIKAETDWYYVAGGDLTEEEIHAKRISIKRDKEDIIYRILSPKEIPENKKLVKKATKKADVYFDTFYHTGGEPHHEKKERYSQRTA